MRVSPNPQEVQAYKYVTQPELRAMMDPASELRWSPWFRCVPASSLLNGWLAWLAGSVTYG